MHILFLVLFQLASVMIPVSFSKKDTLLSVRMFTTSYFLFGVQDILISYMMWFIIQEGNSPTFVIDEKANCVYQVAQVLETAGEESYEDESDSERTDEVSATSEYDHMMSFTMSFSSKMIA